MRRASRVEYRGEWPAEARAAVEASMAGLEWLIPDWCTELILRWDSAPPDAPDGTAGAACTTACYEYRWACIRVYPSWLEGGPAERRQELVHELLHVFTAPLVEYVEKMADRLLKEDAPKFHATVREEIRERQEAATQDLSHAINRRDCENAA